MWVVSIKGKHVFQGSDIICTITKISNLDKIRIYIKQKYNIEFESTAAISTPNWKCFHNISDDRDITLIIENVYTEEDINSVLS